MTPHGQTITTWDDLRLGPRPSSRNEPAMQHGRPPSQSVWEGGAPDAEAEVTGDAREADLSGTTTDPRRQHPAGLRAASHRRP